MSWYQDWEGRATDFAPELLHTTGKPGRVADRARDAIWEAVQRVAEHDVRAWVAVSVSGWETPEKPGLGRFNLSLQVCEEPQEISQRIAAQRPVDLTQESSPPPGSAYDGAPVRA